MFMSTCWAFISEIWTRHFLSSYFSWITVPSPHYGRAGLLTLVGHAFCGTEASTFAVPTKIINHYVPITPSSVSYARF